MSAELAAMSLLNERFLLDYPLEAARVLETLPADATADALQNRSAAAQLRTWQALAPDRAADVLEALPAESMRRLLAESEPQTAMAALAHLDRAKREAMVAALPEGPAADLRALMEYPQDTAGALMDPRVGAFSATLTIVEAIERLRGMRQRGLRELFAVDEQMQLIGQIEVEDLVLASRDRTIRDIVHRVSATVRDTDKITHVAQTLQQYPQSVLPVLNETGRFLGVIRNSQLSERQAGRGRSRWFRWG